MSMFTGIGASIVRSSAIRGGRPRVAGTGVTVQRIVGLHRRGLTPEEIAGRIGHVRVEQVAAALLYYETHRDEIDTDLAADEALTAALERQQGVRTVD